MILTENEQNVQNELAWYSSYSHIYKVAKKTFSTQSQPNKKKL
jgi:hypothetical protein